MSFSLAPGLLIAMPNLVDPNFFRSVVLLCAHNDEGAFGLVINHVLDLPVQAICEEAEIAWRGDDSEKALCGGPVERQRGWLLHPIDRQFEGTQLVGEGIGLTASRDGLVAYANEPSGTYKLLLGYAGWGPGQLDREMLHGSWLDAPLDVGLVFDCAREQIWERALRSVGVHPENLVEGTPQIH